MHRLPGQDFQTIDILLSELVQKERQNDAGLELGIVLIDVLLAARLVQSSQPVRVLEYGSGDGRLSFHLAKLLGAFHEESELVCACNMIDGLWMEQIAEIEKLPRLSYFAGDYGCFQLQKDYFDLVVINGRTNFQEPQEVIEDAITLTVKNGALLCYTDNTPLLESTFKLYFEKRDEYKVTPFNKVLLAKAKDQRWTGRPEIDMETLGREDLAAAGELFKQKNPGRKEILTLTDKLQKDILTAARMGRSDWKIRLLEEKEKLVDLAVQCQKQ